MSLFVLLLCVAPTPFDGGWRRRFRAALSQCAIEPQELTALTTQDAFFARLFGIRHVTSAAAAAVDLKQSAHRGPAAYLRLISRQGA